MSGTCAARDRNDCQTGALAQRADRAQDPSLGFACFGEAVEDGDDTPSPIAGAGVDSDDGELVDHRAVGLAREAAPPLERSQTLPDSCGPRSTKFDPRQKHDVTRVFFTT